MLVFAGILLLIILILVVPIWIAYGTAGFWKNIWWGSVKSMVRK